MHFGFRQIIAAISGAAVIFCCSCEKHPLGQDPEVQREKMNVESASGQNPGATKERSTSPSPTPSPTAVEFFPETSPTP
jgi:hypothetical protein